MLNVQKREKPVYRGDGTLDIVKIWETIQGEGPFAGVPAIFIRLAGCNLDCPYCDTDYTSNRRLYTADEVVQRVTGSSLIRPLIVFTGGEPFRQYLTPVLTKLLDRDYRVQVETNGTLFPLDYHSEMTLLNLRTITVVCSPKSPELNLLWAPYITAYKYVVEAGHVDVVDGLPTRALGGMRPARPLRKLPVTNIYVQPCDLGDEVKNKANMAAAVESCMKYGYRLCLQLHKIVGLE